MHTVGIKIGHFTDRAAHTGCTVFLLPDGVTVSADHSGLSPGSREAALVHPTKRIQYAHAILLTGGSAFGLAAADGVMRYLAERGIGHETPIRPIPLVPTAVIFDLFFNRGQSLPDAAAGYAACVNATLAEPAEGNVGVGAGATVGKWGGFPGPMKGGFGLTRLAEGELEVWAAVVVNAVGDVVAEDGRTLAGARHPDGRWKADENPHRLVAHDLPAMTNTTLAVVATNARLDKIQAFRVAGRAHDGMAQSVRPIHTSRDGDTAFAVATNQIDAPYDWVANLAADATATAIRRAVRAAATVGDVLGLAS